MWNSRSSKIGVVAVATLALTFLAGCTADAGNPSAATPTVKATEPESSASATPTVSAPAVTPGEVLPTEPAAMPEGTTAFPLSDGTFVAVSATEPLPEPVMAAAQATVSATVSSDVTSMSLLFEATDAAKSIAKSTGKEIVVVFRSFGSCGDEPDGHPAWTATKVDGRFAAGDCYMYGTSDEAVAWVMADIAQRANPESFEVVVQP